MGNENAWPETVIIWGAGATKYAGLLATQDVANSINHIAEKKDPEDYDFSKLFPGNKIAQQLRDGFIELIKLLESDEKIKRDYDFEALRLIAKISSRFFDVNLGEKTTLDLQELFTLMDQLIDSSLGLEVLADNGRKIFLTVNRIIAARNCLKILTEELQRIAIQSQTPGKMSKAKFYHDLAGTLAGLMTKEAFEFESRGYTYVSRAFYLFSYAIISFNWDPLLLWALFNSHKERNDSPPYMKKCLPLRLFSDLGVVVATRLVEGDSKKIWFSANEAQVIKINESDKYPSRIMRMGKLLFPHGIFGSRLCPQCGKLLNSFGHIWDKDKSLPFGPSLIDQLQPEWKYNKEEKEKGAINCPFCRQMTYPYDMPLEMQTVIKRQAIGPINEIKKEMGLLIKHARHIVFAGYSMPRDDISEKLFLISSLSGQDIKAKKCTIILFDEDYASGADWLTGTGILSFLNDKRKIGSDISASIKNILSIFELEKTRLTLKGIPNIFYAYPNLESAVLDIFYHNCFPPDRHGKS